MSKKEEMKETIDKIKEWLLDIYRYMYAYPYSYRFKETVLGIDMSKTNYSLSINDIRNYEDKIYREITNDIRNIEIEPMCI